MLIVAFLKKRIKVKSSITISPFICEHIVETVFVNFRKSLTNSTDQTNILFKQKYLTTSIQPLKSQTVLKLIRVLIMSMNVLRTDKDK